MTGDASHTKHSETYRWPSESLVSQMELRGRGDASVAYLYASDAPTTENTRLAPLSDRLRARGWHTFPEIKKGQSALRVSGFGSPEALTRLLTENGFTSGAPKVTTESPHAERHAAKAIESLRSESLRNSGLFYMLGNILFIFSGVRRKDYAQLGTGISFTLGDGMLAAFGCDSDAGHLHVLLTQLEAHLHSQGIEIPVGADAMPETLARRDGLLENIYDYVHEHINIFKCLAEVVGGAFYFRAGLNQNNTRKAAAGAVIIAGWAAAMLIHEKKTDPEKLKDAGGVEKLKAAIQEKPLRLAGWSGLVHNVLSIAGAVEERGMRPGTGFYKYDLAAISCMLVANTLYSISHKTNGDFKDHALLNDVYSMAAHIALSQPELLRETAVREIADFMAHRPETNETQQRIAQHLHDQIRLLSRNPWFAKAAPTLQSAGRV